MSDLEIFGSLVLGTEPEEAVEATLQEWLPTYLGRTERLISKFTLPQIKSFTITSDWDHFPEEQLPAVLIMGDGATDPRMDGRTYYRAIFPIHVGIFVEARDRRTTDQLAKYYAATVRELLLHKGSLGNFALATTWVGEKYGAHVTDRSQRTIGTAQVDFNVEVREVARRLVGPATPAPEPKTEQGPIPVATKGTITLTRERI